jgi:hypothetical protein
MMELVLPLIVLGLVILTAADRIALRWTGHSVIPWRSDANGTPITTTSFEELDAFYQGTKRFELEERTTRLVIRDENHNGEPPFADDLAAGHMMIRRPAGEG